MAQHVSGASPPIIRSVQLHGPRGYGLVRRQRVSSLGRIVDCTDLFRPVSLRPSAKRPVFSWCGISARFRATAFPTFFHPYMSLAAAFQFRIWSRPSSSLNNFVPSSSRLSHGPSSSETSSYYFLGYRRIQSPGWYRYNLKTVSFQMSSSL